MREIEEYIKSKRPNTARCYAQALRQFCALIGDRPLESVEPKDAARFLTWLKARGVADKTIRSRIDALRSIYGYLEDIDLVPRSPFRAIRRMISTRQAVQVRPTQLIEGAAVLEVLEGLPHTREGVRDRGILSALFGGGLRRSEGRALKVGDVLTSGDRALVLSRTKSGTRQLQPLPSWAWEHLAALVAQRKGDGATATDPLFVLYYAKSARWREISDRTFLRIYRTHIGAACHSARATFATQLLEQRYSYQDVARALRHGDIQQVCVYDKRRRELRDNCATKINFASASNDDDFVIDGKQRRA